MDAAFRRVVDDSWIHELDQLARHGFELDGPVDDDLGLGIRPGEESPMRLVEDEE
jgi:hypothetical protein